MGESYYTKLREGFQGPVGRKLPWYSGDNLKGLLRDCEIPLSTLLDLVKNGDLPAWVNGLRVIHSFWPVPSDPPGHIHINVTEDIVCYFSYMLEDLIRVLGTPQPSENQQDVLPQPAVPTSTPVGATDNFFIKKGDGWNLGFMGQIAENVKHLNGFSYIAHLLQRPGESIKDSDLDQIVSGKGSDSSVSEDTAISNRLFVAVKGQAVTSKKGQQVIKQKWDELQDELVDAGMERQEEIQEELAKLEPFMNTKHRNFANPNDKKLQSNITNRLDDAFTAIQKRGLNKMANHLKNNIKTDGAYGRYYSGDLPWDTL